MRLGSEVMEVEQVITLTPEALGRLRTAAEAFVVLDLRVPGGNLQGAVLTVGERTFAGAELVPTMPKLRESTATGGRDRRAYPQWWAVPLEAGSLPPNAGIPLRITLRVPAGLQVDLGGDRFSDQQRAYEGPSFGDWPHFVALKLEYDGDHRLGVHRRLESAGTRSALIASDGTRRAVPFVHRIRVITLGNDVGALEWESEPVPLAPRVTFGFPAYSGNRGQAALTVSGQAAITFPLGGRRDYTITNGGWALCYRAEPPRQDKAYGTYFLSGPAPPPGAPASLHVGFETGMSLDPMFVVIDGKRPRSDLVERRAGCATGAAEPLLGVGRVKDATRNNYPEDTGRWTVSGVF